MKRTLGMLLALAVLTLSMNGLMSGALAQDATPTVDPAMVQSDPITTEDCQGVTEYARILVTLGAGLAAASYGLPSAQVSEWSDEAYTAFLAALTGAIGLSGEPGEGIIAGFVAAAVVGSLVYCAAFLWLSIATSRALIVGLLYVFIWQGVVVSLFSGVRY